MLSYMLFGSYARYGTMEEINILHSTVTIGWIL